MRRLSWLIAAGLALGGCAKTIIGPVSVKLKRSVELVKTLPLCAATIPNRWASSWPVPTGGKQGNEFKVLFFTVDQDGTGIRLNTPMGEAVLDAETREATACSARKGEHKALSSRRFGAKASAFGLDEFDSQADLLFDRIEKAGALYAARGHDQTLLEDFVSRFNVLAEPDLLPYSYRINPEFWEWVRSETGRSIPKP